MSGSKAEVSSKIWTRERCPTIEPIMGEIKIGCSNQDRRKARTQSDCVIHCAAGLLSNSPDAASESA